MDALYYTTSLTLQYAYHEQKVLEHVINRKGDRRHLKNVLWSIL